MTSGIDAAALVKKARARAGLSQRALAREAGTSQSVVARIETGETSPTVATLNRLLEAAGSEGAEPDAEGVEPDAGSAEPGTAPAHGPGEGEIVRRLRAFFDDGSVPGLVSAYLFGSTARGRRHGESDVDVAVLLDRSVHPSRAERSEVRVRLCGRLVAALGLNDVDLVVLNDVPPGLARRIVLDGVRLVRADPARDHAFVRDVQLRAADLAPFLRRTAALKLDALVR